MEVEQMMAYLLAEIRINREKWMLIKQKMDLHHEKMDACLVEMRTWRRGTAACQKVKKPASEEIESEVKHKEVPKEEAVVKPVRALKKRLGDWNLALGCCGQLKERTQGSGGSWKKFATTYRWMIRGAIPPQHQIQGQDSLTSGAPKGWMFGKRHRAKPKGMIGRNHGSRQELRLATRAALGKIFRKTEELEVTKQIVWTSIRLQKMSNWTL
jgi:hypothetical protein